MMSAPRSLISKIARRPVLADVLADLLQVVADAGMICLVAPGTAAEVAGLQHDDVGDAVLSQLRRGVDPGEAAADHHTSASRSVSRGGKDNSYFLVAV